ncbi:Hypothetical_protein [Hexamita inflata]|uniref:Hypothetical_protein n=1 Tax=Hexamita inflata TaxID=28002 RepID=A0AA86UA64_9EUKA|nr:Hypothetical protein HINF_LOCUS22383 [Hexamita inflata]
MQILVESNVPNTQNNLNFDDEFNSCWKSAQMKILLYTKPLVYLVIQTFKLNVAQSVTIVELIALSQSTILFSQPQDTLSQVQFGYSKVICIFVCETNLGVPLENVFVYEIHLYTYSNTYMTMMTRAGFCAQKCAF